MQMKSIQTKKRIFGLLLLASVGLLFAIMIHGSLRDADANEATRDAVREVIFRKILPRQGTAYLSIKTKNPNHWICSIIPKLHFCDSPSSDNDPSDAFLLRFRDYKTKLGKVSSTEKAGGGVIDKQTRKPVAIYWVSDMRRISATEYELMGGYYCGGLCSEGTTYRVRLVNHRWIIMATLGGWIS